MLGRMPPEERIAYEWSEGTVPPPYYYEFAITVTLGGGGSGGRATHTPGDGADDPEEYRTGAPRGWVRLLPDYEQHGAPSFVESFSVDAAGLARLMRELESTLGADPPRGALVGRRPVDTPPGGDAAPPAADAAATDPAASDAAAPAADPDSATADASPSTAVGGSVERIEWHQAGHPRTIIRSDEPHDNEALTALAARVRALVPAETWRRLSSRRARYWRERGDEPPPLAEER